MTLEKWNGEKITVAEAVRRLATLTERQHAVFALRCQGLPYKEIANRLVVAESDVKTHMGAVYQKLGLDDFSEGRRSKALSETFCPVLNEGDLPPPLPDPDELEPVPEEVQAMVDVDEAAFTPPPRGAFMAMDPAQSLTLSRPRRRGWIGWVVFFLVIGIIIASYYFLWPNLSGMSSEAREVIEEISSAVVEATEETSPTVVEATQESSPAVVEDIVLTLTAAVQQVADLEGTGTALAQGNSTLEVQAAATEAATSTPPPSATATEPLPTPTITPLPLPTDTSPGSVLDLQQIWREEGVELIVLDDHQFDIGAKQLYLNFKFKNETGKNLLIQYGIDNISAVDDLGNRMPILGIWINRGSLIRDHYNSVEMLLEPRQEIRNTYVNAPLRIQLDTGIMCDISEITIIFTNISRIDEAKWRIPVDIC